MQNNIRQLRKERGWSLQELAARIEGAPHYTTVQKLERNVRGLNTEWMGKLAKAFGVSPEALIVSNDRPVARMVPLIGNIAAGAWQEAIHDPMGYVVAPPGGPHVFALRPSGTSMNRVIMPDAYVLVDPDQKALQDGKIYAVRNDQGETTVKYYRAEPPRLEPSSTDPTHQPIAIGEEPFTIVGRVVWQGQELG